ncbi:MAG: hypothetical protein AAB627_00940 [Patescibacteria group bacterium]
MAEQKPEIRAEEVKPGTLRLTIIHKDSRKNFSFLVSATPDRVEMSKEVRDECRSG